DARTPIPIRWSTGRASPTRASAGTRRRSCCGRSRSPFVRDARLRAGDQPIAETARRLDRHLADLGLLELLAQPSDVDVDQTRVAPRLIAPHADEKIVAGEHAAGLARERAQELELRRREGKLPVPGHRLQAREVDDESAEAELPLLAVVGARAIAAEERLDARCELVVVERLAEIVVGADPQANHAIGRVVLRREEQHWYVRIATELQAETDPVDARHEHIEGDEVGAQLG